ncbi:hypothetical protein [Amycolatopsis aidingensis]|uniref:hypothetical protein n=1 Tax=Amycolatopsis aidingensis TaxID=2842453 RepID=UPI001C0B6B8E|nr:hypothetical protein [Amycolatopsis aidingensis]
MTEDVLEVVLGVLAAGISAAIGWFTRTFLWRRRLRRKQRFLGLPRDSDALLVVNRHAGREDAVDRYDVFTLLELSALIKDCGAQARIVAHDLVRQGLGQQAEFCVGGPVSNRRMAAHLRAFLPGVAVNTGLDPEGPADQCVFQVGTERYHLEKGNVEYVILARLSAERGARPVFLFCGQVAITNQAATRYLARHHRKLARKYHDDSFCLLLKVVNSEAYGPDIVELVADVTRTAREPIPN